MPTGNKTQMIRLLDVFVFGPLMIAGAVGQRSKYFRTALMLIGAGTILYNGANYLTNVQREKEAAEGDQAVTTAGLGQRIAPDPRHIYRRRRVS